MARQSKTSMADLRLMVCKGHLPSAQNVSQKASLYNHQKDSAVSCMETFLNFIANGFSLQVDNYHYHCE